MDRGTRIKADRPQRRCERCHCEVAALLSVFVWTGMALAQTDNQVAINLGNSFYASNATYTDSSLFAWPTATPASQGMSAAMLESGSAALAGDGQAASFLVVRGGKLVHESYFNGALPADAKNLHSASKGILSALVGIAIDEGLLSLGTRIGDVLPHAMSAGHRDITVEHLLTMTSGIDWNEDQTEYSLGSKFVQSILDLPLQNAPGSKFNYSTGDTHLLGAVIADASGQSLHQFGRQRLFDPLGIDVERWGRDRQGYFSGGANFFLTPREMAAFGQLYLDGGRWGGSQIVPADWILESISSQGRVSYYGYLWWRDVNLDGHRGYRAWGWGKQFLYVLPSLNLVVAITHDTNGNVSDDDLNDFVRNFIINAVTGPPVLDLPGDFNSNGVVDAADYTMWRDGLGMAAYTPADYDIWKNNFAATAALGAADASIGKTAVPEPASMLLAIVAAALAGFRPRRE